MLDKQIERLTVLWMVSVATAVFFGYYVRENFAPVAPVVIVPVIVYQPYIPCDTDTDCLEKNGCGGYEDPCSEEPEVYTGVEEISA